MQKIYTGEREQVEDLNHLLTVVRTNRTYDQIHRELGSGVTTAEAERSLATHGPNVTPVPQKSFLSVLFTDILTPSYIFQLFSIILWAFWNDYPIYAGILGGFSIVTLIVKFIKINGDHQRLVKNANYETEVKVYRLSSEQGKKGAQECKTICSKFLVPGDLIEIQSNKILPCDVALLEGTCITNESMLTGNSAPVAKEQLPMIKDKVFDPITSQQHILYAGTEVAETRPSNLNTPVLGVVLNTGFSTVKGRLIKDHLKPKSNYAHFWSDAVYYFAGLIVLAIVTFAFSLYFMIDQGKDAGYVVRKTFDMVTIAIPGALPTYMTIGGLISVLRLKRKKILTRGTQKINAAGSVNIMCFEKSGALTRDTIDFGGVRVASKESNKVSFLPLVGESIHSFLNSSQEKIHTHEMLELMATCHGLTSIKGVIAGDTMDRKMFEATGWRIKETPNRVCTVNPPITAETGYYKPVSEVHVFKRFEFSPKFGTMSVIVRDTVEGRQRVYVKGAPDMVSALCRQDTIPENLTGTVAAYEQNGFKVLGCATKKLLEDVDLNDQKLDRVNFEKDLEFLGILVFDNKLRDESSQTIHKLKEAGITPVMLTGDEVLNSVFVARKCGILEENQRVMFGSLTSRGGAKRVEWKQTNISKKEGATDNGELAPLNQEKEQHNIDIEMTNRGTKNGNDVEGEFDGLVSKESNIAIAITGDAFAFFCSSADTDDVLKNAVLKKTKVFAQMRPEQKAFVIEEFRKQGLIVGMCGSGVEDCPALNAANVSIALGQTDASAAALFTSKVNNVKIVDTILREGRAILTNHIQAFRFLCMYAFIQTFSAIYAYSRETVISEASFFYQDIFPVLIPAITVFFTSPTDKLSKKQPERLLSLAFVLGMLGQCLFHAISQFLGVVFLRNQSWYQTPNQMRVAAQERTCDEFAEYADYDATVLFLIGNIQYFGAICAFSIGRPFKKSWFNILYVFFVGYTGLMSLIIMLVRMPAVIDVLDIADFEVKQSFRWVIFACAAIDVFVTIVWEKLIVPIIVLIVQKMGMKVCERVTVMF